MQSAPSPNPHSAIRNPQLTVTDTGPGIPPSVRPHIFDPFYSGREAGRGLGLGLSKAWRIVDLHGGRIEVESPTEGGAAIRNRNSVPARTSWESPHFEPVIVLQNDELSV